MAGRRVVLVPGNHDHRLAEPLLDEVALAGSRARPRAPRACRPASRRRRIAAWLGEAELSIAYPGVWLRDDVYATHGHYMDCHMSLPRLECVAAAAIMRAGGPPARSRHAGRLRARPAPDLRLLLRPRRGRPRRPAPPGPPSALGARSPAGTATAAALRRAAAKAAVAPASRAASGCSTALLRADFEPDLSAAAITRSGIDAATEMSRRLRVEAAHTITGHTHRGGPEASDGEWPLPGGGRLHNTGSWVFADAFHHPGAPPGPYWPGTVTWVEDEGPPRRVRLLLDQPREELRAAVSRRLSAYAQPLGDDAADLRRRRPPAGSGRRSRSDAARES